MISFGKSMLDIRDSGIIRTIIRKPQTLKAKTQNLLLKSTAAIYGDKMVISTIAASNNTATPMITSRTIIDLKKLANSGMFTGIDLRNLNVSIDGLRNK